MRAPWLPVCALLALGCSADPSPTDASADGAVPLDGGGDGAALPDAADAPPADTPRGDVVDAGAPDVPDAGAAPDAPPGDAGAAPDASPGDAPDVPAADVVDAGPADAGPQVYALDPPTGAVEGHVLYQRTPCAAPCSDPPDTIALGATCTRTGALLNFTLRGCTFGPTSCLQITGQFPDYRSATGATLAIVGGVANQGRDLRVSSGTAVAGRQSFHVQFAATPAGSAVGATGVPGRTVSPDLGDLWLLGCELR